jgi:hypothetical protein
MCLLTAHVNARSERKSDHDGRSEEPSHVGGAKRKKHGPAKMRKWEKTTWPTVAHHTSLSFAEPPKETHHKQVAGADETNALDN